MSIIVGNNNGSTQIATTPNPNFVPTLQNFQVQTVGQTTVASETWVINETAYMFMRAKAITFKVQGLRPNTRYYPFFNNVYVGNYCSTTNGQQQSNIVTDSRGEVVGVFYLPGGVFTVGSHQFKLVDNYQVVSGATVADPIYGQVEATYQARGILNHVQTQLTTTSFDPAILTPVNVTLNPIYAAATPAGLVAPRPAVCESWFFEYQVTSSRTLTFSVTTSSSSAPINPKPVVGTANVTIDPATIAYISTTTTSTGLYVHTYSYRVPTKTVYRQEWIGRTTDSRPSLSSFRPTGIPPTDAISITKQWTRIGNVACPAFLQVRVVQVDPLAQSFFIEPAISPNGVFVTSVNVYFRSVDQSTPVTLELRDMVNGLPGPNILPNGVVVVPGYATGQSPDATVATTFVFDNPIFLRPNTEYCFVLKSSSLGYNAWCSRLGDNDVATGKRIDVQPFSGVLFKSANDTTWQPDSMEDLKFDLNVAVFNTSAVGDVIARPIADSSGNYYHTAHTLPLSYISTTSGSSVLTIRIPAHGLVTGDTVKFGTVPGTTYNGIAASALQNASFAATIVDSDKVTITVAGQTATRTGPFAVNDLFSRIDTVPAIMPTSSTLIAGEKVINPDNLSPATVPNVPSSALTQPTPPSSEATNTFVIYTNMMVNEVMIDYMGTEVGGTDIQELIKIASGTSTAGTETPYQEQPYVEITSKNDYYSFDEPRLFASKDNEALHSVELGSQKSLTVNFKLSSTDKDVSPVIDSSHVSLIVKTFDIDNQDGEIDALNSDPSSVLADYNDPAQNSEINHGSGNAASKYKGRIVRLNHFATQAQIFVTANCPDPAFIDCYIRTSTDDFTHVDRDWEWVPINGVLKTAFNHSPSKNAIGEWMFIYNTNTKFSVYDVKLVMRSTNNSIVPKIYGVRAITNNV